MNKWTSSGGIVLADLSRPFKVYVRLPTNNYGPWSLPKGRVDRGESLEATALREVYEEIGVPAEILSHSYLGAHEGDHSVTHFYVMEQVGPQGQHDSETEKVKIVTLDEAEELFRSSGNLRDARVIQGARQFLDENYPSDDNEVEEATLTSEENGITGQPLNELHLNLLGKLTLAAMGAWLVGKVTNVKLRGNKREVSAVANALMASKRFQDELRRPGASVQSVMDKLGVKHMTAREFERVFQVKWPL